MKFKTMRENAGFATQVEFCRFFDLSRQTGFDFDSERRQPPKSVLMILHYLINGGDRDLLDPPS